MKHFQLSSFFKGIEQKPPDPKEKTKGTGKGTGRGKGKGKGNGNVIPTEKEIVVEKPPPKKHKKHIPIALREQVWIKQMGRVFQGKCPTTWCQNIITVFDFHSGHNIPESKGGPTTLENLIPLCSRCNLSMGNDYTIDEWSAQFEPPGKTEEAPKSKKWFCYF